MITQRARAESIIAEKTADLANAVTAAYSNVRNAIAANNAILLVLQNSLGALKRGFDEWSLSVACRSSVLLVRESLGVFVEAIDILIRQTGLEIHEQNKNLFHCSPNEVCCSNVDAVKRSTDLLHNVITLASENTYQLKSIMELNERLKQQALREQLLAGVKAHCLLPARGGD